MMRIPFGSPPLSTVIACMAMVLNSGCVPEVSSRASLSRSGNSSPLSGYPDDTYSLVVGQSVSVSPSNPGVGNFTCSISPALPAGLMLGSSTCSISGAPTAESPLARYTVTATNRGSQSSSVTVRIQVQPSHRNYLYVADQFGRSVRVFSMNSADGSLSESSNSGFASGIDLNYLAIDPERAVGFFPDYGERKLWMNPIDRNSGSLRYTSASPGDTTLNTSAVSFHPGGSYVYVASGTRLYAFSISSGALSVVPGSPLILPDYNTRLVVHPSGNYLVAPINFNQTVHVYSISASNGALSAVAGSPFSVSGRYNGLAFSPDGAYLFMTDSGNNRVASFAFDSQSGSISEVSGSPYVTGTAPQRIAVHATEPYLYVANFSSGSISAYSYNGSGQLSQIVGSPFSAGSGVQALAVDPSGGYLYASNSSGGSLSAYSINSGTGALAELVGSPISLGGNGVSYPVELQAVRIAQEVRSGSAEVPMINYRRNIELVTGESVTAAAANIGGDITSCTISPALPAGFTLDVETCGISGSSGVVVARSNYVVTASNGNGSSIARVYLRVATP